MSISLCAARPDLGDGGNLRPVVDLLVEQIECADYIILNKIDQLDAAQLESLKGIASSLNPLSRVSSSKALDMVKHAWLQSAFDTAPVPIQQ